MTSKEIIYSEIFGPSFQGEGYFTGRTTAWVRFFACNLSCQGFGQKDPTDPSTYILPAATLDVSKYTTLEQLPIFEYGCDSAYSVAKKYKHLVHKDTAFNICDKIQSALFHETNPGGLFLHPYSRQQIHLAFTGGEPMLNQKAMAEIIEEFVHRNNFPNFVTVETNGTVLFNSDKLWQTINEWYTDVDSEWFWSVSPKLFSTSGEKAKKAIRPDVVAQYAQISDHGQLKYVVNGTNQSWDEVDSHTRAFRDAGVDWDVYIMPVGATKESQEEDKVAEIAVEAMKRGYHVSGRLHTYIFGNKIGT